ncbi:iron-containing alcohol dehydrogenase [Amnimonas aquatica]|uniref:NADH-dependent alcohol dehydrogenase n=1 Tax=Amnimonas aquatica TaxID=2094561 RepID=A0A2P6AT17_9GAMM|nr:iron-containing alcohol dehydrogenase [Amnimonas aquatica]PQA44690.1 NADH-dependent alcohol dehydrogenase [Amnimonas aquatica]
MLNFTYRNPVKVLFGTGMIAAIGKEIPAGARVLVTYGGGSVQKTGTLAEVRAALDGRTVIEFGGIEPNPSYETLMRAVALAREENADWILAVGGGSVMDGSKFIAAAVHHEGDPLEILHSRGRAVKQALPLGVVVTLAATGSETNSGSVVTHLATHSKLAFSHPLLYPRFAVMDPAKTLTLPVRQVGNGVVDAFVHVVEQYLTYPVDARIQDRFAEGILLTLIEEGPRALSEPDNVDVRANLMWAASQALNGLIGAGVPQDWSTHMLGHELTAAHGLDHAQTLAIVLPAMLAERRDAKREKLLQYAERVWGLTPAADETRAGGDARIDAAIARTRDFFERMQVPTRLSAYGIGTEALDHLLAQLQAHGMVKLGERQEVTPEVSRRVLEACL